MCFGAIVMGNIRNLRVAARDGYAGATYLSKIDPYIKSKNVHIEFTGGALERVQIVLQCYFELNISNGKGNVMMDCFEKDVPDAARFAKTLYHEKYLESCVKNCTEIKEVFNTILERM